MEYTEEDDILEIVQRWDNTGLLYGLPMYEKQELAPIFENVTRVALSKYSNKEVPRNISDLMDSVMFPICRRLYRRVGSDFDIEKMINDLIKKVTENQDMLTQTDDKTIKDKFVNPIVSFCIEFADQYSDELINRKQFNETDYKERIVKMLKTIENVLLNPMMTSFIDRSSDNWVVIDSESISSNKGIRIHNQKVALEVFSNIIKDTNKGI